MVKGKGKGSDAFEDMLAEALLASSAWLSSMNFLNVAQARLISDNCEPRTRVTRMGFWRLELVLLPCSWALKAKCTFLEPS